MTVMGNTVCNSFIDSPSGKPDVSVSIAERSRRGEKDLGIMDRTVRGTETTVVACARFGRIESRGLLVIVGFASEPNR